MSEYGRMLMEKMNAFEKEKHSFEIAIRILKDQPKGQKYFVSQFFIESINDKAGKDVLKSYLENNDIKFINNKGENCEQYLKQIELR